MKRSGLIGRAGSDPQTWEYVWTPGTNLENLFALYDSLGDVTIAAPTQWTTTLDGPMKVFRAGNLTVNAALTFSNRCRGVVPLLESLTMGASGSISMTGKGAAGSAHWVNQDIVVPSYITLTGKNTSLQEFLQWIRETGYFICDPNLFASPPPGMGDVQADYAAWPARGTALISATGCGAPSFGNGYPGPACPAGSAGTNAPGAGGPANYGPYDSLYQSGRARVWGGGAGAGGQSGAGIDVVADQYGGPGGVGTAANGSGGGGAGNPGGAGSGPGSTVGADGTGGILLIIVRENISVTTGHVLSANGMPGGVAYGGSQSANGGGGSGGGFVAVIRGGTLAGTLSLTATGGAGGTASGAAYNWAGGPGGAGATRSLTFTGLGL